jgi:PleD family two-component response regulator
MEDVNDIGQERQKISQERNELSLIKDAHRVQIRHLHSEIEEKKQANEHLEFISRIDGLTGIANRRYFDEKLEKEYKRHSR